MQVYTYRNTARLELICIGHQNVKILLTEEDKKQQS